MAAGSAVSVRSRAAESIVVMCGVPQGLVQTPVPSDGARSGQAMRERPGRSPPEAAPVRDVLPRGSRHHNRYRSGTDCWQVFGLVDEGLEARPTRRFPVAEDQCVERGRFHLPLRGSSGFAPDSLLSPTGSRASPDTNGTHDIGDGVTGQHKMWCRCVSPDPFTYCDDGLHKAHEPARINSAPPSRINQVRCPHHSHCRTMN